MMVNILRSRIKANLKLIRHLMRNTFYVISSILVILTIVYDTYACELLRVNQVSLFNWIFKISLINFTLLISSIIIRRKNSNKTDTANTQHKLSISLFNIDSNFISILLLIMALAYTGYIFSYRYRTDWTPRGSDTMYYAYRIQLLAQGIIIPDRIVLDLIGLFIYKLGLDIEITTALLPIIIGYIHTISSFMLFKVTTGNKLLASLAALFAPLYFFVIRLSWDLLANFLGQALMMVVLAYYLNIYNVRNNYDLKTIIPFISSFIILLFTYPPLWLVTGSIILLHILINIPKYYRELSIVKIFILFTIILLIAFIMPQTSRFLVGSISSVLRHARFKYDVCIWTLWHEVRRVLLASLFGLILMSGILIISCWKPISRKELLLTEVLTIWFFINSCIAIINYDPRRSPLLYPLHIPEALLLYICLSNFCKLSIFTRLYIHVHKQNNSLSLTIKRPEALPTLIIIPLILSYMIMVQVPKEIPIFNYIPPPHQREALYKIREILGFNNRTIPVLINSYSGGSFWPQAIVGSNVYRGSLLNYLVDNWRKTAQYVLLHESLYRLSQIEKDFTNPLEQDLLLLNLTKLLNDPNNLDALIRKNTRCFIENPLKTLRTNSSNKHNATVNLGSISLLVLRKNASIYVYCRPFLKIYGVIIKLRVNDPSASYLLRVNYSDGSVITLNVANYLKNGICMVNLKRPYAKVNQILLEIVGIKSSLIPIDYIAFT